MMMGFSVESGEGLGVSRPKEDFVKT